VTEHTYETAPSLTDAEVRALGYAHRDEDGYWQRPDPVRRPFGAEATSMAVDADTAMMRALVDAYDGNVTAAAADWCIVKHEVDEQHAHEIAAIEQWQPTARVGAGAEHMSSADYDAALERIKPKPTVGAVQRRRDDATKGSEWAFAALEGEARAVADAVQGLRHEQLRASTWTLSRPDVAEHLDPHHVEDVLTDAAQAAGLTRGEARSTIRSTQRARGVR
jgi:hypothetical protein